MTKILIVDDNPLVRKMIRRMIEQHPDWTVCGESADGREGILKHALLKPHITVMDFSMPEVNGLEAARQILMDQPSARILILSVEESSGLIEEVKKTGIKGFCSKNTMGVFFEAVETILRGEHYFHGQPNRTPGIPVDPLWE